VNAGRTIFEPAEHESVADSVVHQIEGLIVAGVLRQGMRLPSERDLTEQLKVSRAKLREALKRLEDKKLIYVRHGGGTYVAQLMGEAMSPALVDLYASHATAFFDYLEYRRQQERIAARWAAERATAVDHAIIKAFLDQMDAAHAAHDTDDAQTADIGFHAAIVDASHNSTLIHMMASIYELTRRGVFYNRDYLRGLDGTGTKLLAQHHAIGNAILMGDADAAADAASAHLDFVEQSFRASQESARRQAIAYKRIFLTEGLHARN